MAETARKVYAGEVTAAADVKRELSAVTPSDSAFSDAMKSAKVSNARLARYFLRSLELANSDDSEPYFIPNDDEVINLEHVLPKRPDGNWGELVRGRAQSARQPLGQSGAHARK